MSQIQEEISNQNINKIKEFFQNAKAQLPTDVFDFKEFVEQNVVDCEFRYDENAEPNKRIKITDNLVANVYEKEFNTLTCKDANVDVIFKNAIYIYDYENNKIILTYYKDVEIVCVLSASTSQK